MAPLRASHEADQLEAELKELFVFLFDTFIRPGEREVNTAGMAHLGPTEQFERAVKAEGLAILRETGSGLPGMRYLYRAWRARNPRRGLHMLRTYLQILWPDDWELAQLWAPLVGTYPTNLLTYDGGAHFLSSRVMVEVTGTFVNGADVERLAASLRSVVPARLLLTIRVKREFSQQVGLVALCDTGIAHGEYIGRFV